MSAAYSHPGALAGRVVIVTGAAQGVGRGIAAALLERGASVLAVDNQADVLAETVGEFDSAGWDSACLVADLRVGGSPAIIVDAALNRFGKVDALVNDAIACNEPKAWCTSLPRITTWCSTSVRGQRSSSCRRYTPR